MSCMWNAVMILTKKVEEWGLRCELRPLSSFAVFVSWSDVSSQFPASDCQGGGSLKSSLYDMLFCFLRRCACSPNMMLSHASNVWALTQYRAKAGSHFSLSSSAV
jgi:hypothetical protein